MLGIHLRFPLAKSNISPTTAAVVATAVIFLCVYWTSPYTPWASNTFDWRNYTDQGLYLRSAVAFSKLAFVANEHFYPPLYSLLAAPFVYIRPIDPFVFVDLACICLSAYLLTRMLESYAGEKTAAICAVALLAVHPLMITAFVTPWTSTVVTPLVLGSVYMLQRAEVRGTAPHHESCLLGLLVGLIFLARPLDGAIAGLLFPFWGRIVSKDLRDLFRHGAAAAAGCSIGIFLFFANNMIIYGSLISPYMNGTSNQLIIADAPVKFVSLFLDSKSLYFADQQTILHAFQWMILSLGATISVLFFGKLWMKATSSVILATITLYCAFDDLVPIGLVHYSNHHYFKWSIILSTMLIIPAISLFAQSPAWRKASIAAILLAVFAISCIHIDTRSGDVKFSSDGDQVTVDVSDIGEFAYVDLSHVRGNWLDIYYSDPRASLDGTALDFRRTVRQFPMVKFFTPLDGGDRSNVRLLLIRPTHGRELKLHLGKMALTETTAAEFGTYNFGFGSPRWLPWLRSTQ
jgi:hypothetical protein